jgi:hypothetical protein
VGRRRLGGVLLLIAAVLGSLLLTRIGGVRIGGSAIAVPGAAEPRPGDCLREVSGPLVDSSRGVFVEPPPASVGETSVSFSDCAEEHVGEVVAFRRPPSPSGAVATGDADARWCHDLAMGYRSHSSERLVAASGGLWEPTADHRSIAVVSAFAEYPWGACAVLAPGLESYSGSYVQSLAGRPVPAPFGRCRSGDHADRWVSCSSPHPVQQFGVAVRAGMLPRGAVDGCRELVRVMTGMPDVNAGGLLKIQVVGGRSTPGGNVDDSTAEKEPVFARCRLIAVGPNLLTGSLIGIGTGQLPLG